MQALTRDELKHMNEVAHDDFVLVNVLSPEKFNKQHIRTSINIPHKNADFVETVEEVAGSNRVLRELRMRRVSGRCPEARGRRVHAGVRL